MGTEKCIALAMSGDLPAMRSCFFFYYTFHYKPDITVAYMHAGLFAAITLVLAAMTYRWPHKHMWIIVATGAVEVAGYVLRAIATEQESLGIFIATTLLLLMAPILLALVNYVIIGQLLSVTGRNVFGLTPRWVSRGFLASDVATFLVQGAGGGIMAIEGMYKVGQPIVLVGLAIQILFFAAFTAVVIYISTRPEYGICRVPRLRPALYGILSTVMLMFLRNVFRVAEFAGGESAPVATEETWFWYFETLPIWLSLVLYAVYHFGRTLPSGPTAEWKAEVAEALKAEVRDPSSSEISARVQPVSGTGVQAV